MPTAKDCQEQLLGELVCLMGGAGTGKSEFAIQSPQPHAILCVDKPVIAMPPKICSVCLLMRAGEIICEHCKKECPYTWLWKYDPNLSFGKFYPPPAKDLTNDKEKPPRNIFDQIIKDIETFKVALHKGERSFTLGGEVWPLPKTIILEGMDFVRDHCVNWTLHTQGKYHMDEFLTADGRPNVFLGWGLVAAKMDELFQNLAFLPSIRPVNVVVTIGLDEETKRQAINGKMEITKTGHFDPAFGGKMSLEAPRKFRDCWLTTREVGKYWMVTSETAKYSKYRGLRSGRFGLAAVEDVTLVSPGPTTNFWNKLFQKINP